MNDKDFDRMNKNQLNQLDSTYPKEMIGQDEIWHQIHEAKSNKAWLYFDWKIGVAASLLIAAFGSWLFFEQDSVQTEGSNDMNISFFELEFEAVSVEEKEAFEFIKKWCVANTVSCKNDDFIALAQQLKESQIQLDMIGHELMVYGNDPAFIKAKSRIEQHRSNVIKQIILTL